MNREQALHILECSTTSTQDEIKSSFRRLSKKYHPDINKAVNAQEMFVRVKTAYDVVSRSAPSSHKPSHAYGSITKYYRIMDSLDMPINLPLTRIDKDIIVYCMHEGKEFRVFLKEGTQLPIKIQVNNVYKHPFFMTFRSDFVHT